MAQRSEGRIEQPTPSRFQNAIMDRLLQRLHRGGLPESAMAVIFDTRRGGWGMIEHLGKGFTCSFDFVCEATDNSVITMVDTQKDKRPVSRALGRHWRKTGEHIQTAMDEAGQEIPLVARDS